MSDSLSSPFFDELLEHLHCTAAKEFSKKLSEVGELSLSEQKLKEALNPLSTDKPMPLDQIIENYQYLFHETGPIHIERRLFEVFTPREYALKVYRGLPRVYQKDSPAQNHVKKDFSHLPILKKLAAERFVFPLYENQPLSPGAKVCLLTWVIGDGWGDWVGAKEALEILKDRFPEVSFDWVALVPKGLSLSADIAYEKDCPVSLFSIENLNRLRSSDLILSMPTFYPHTEELMKTLQNIPSSSPLPRLACIGQYGFLESSWFHPKSGARSMGLHFLEKGILIRKSMNPNFALIESESLNVALFGQSKPSPLDIEKYLDTHRFYLAYLLSSTGGAVYLHALLKSLEKDDQPIDICTPNVGWLIQYVAQQKKEGRPSLEGNFGVKAIDVHYENKVYPTPISDRGKKVRILCPEKISDADFRLLVRMSGEFVGVRGDQSFSEVVSANKVFFYDGALHARYFIKDLLALAENRLSPHRSSLQVFRGMGRVFRHTLPVEDEEWVDETHFQEKQPWVAIAQSVGHALQDPEVVTGFKKFNRILGEEHSFNTFLCQLVQRELVHRSSESIGAFEEKQMNLFGTQQCTLVQLLQSLRGLLEKK